MRLYVVMLANGVARPVHATLPDSPAIVDYATALKICAGNPGSTIKEYN